MKLIKPSVEYIPQEEVKIPYRHIEKCARTCYKSEDRITEDSAYKFVEGLIMAGHLAMLEHGTIYLQTEVNRGNLNYSNLEGRYLTNPYSKFVIDGGVMYLTTNMRVLVENNWLDDLKYSCVPTPCHIKRYTVRFICARIDSQSITRYRTNSFAQESQRFINYMKEKYGASVTFVEPAWVKPEDLEELKEDIKISEQLYNKWLNKGYKPEEARYFLINGTKTEIIVTAFEDDWKHFFDQRLRNSTGRPSPDMHNLAELAWNELKDKVGVML